MKVLIVANYAKEHINKFHISTIKRFRERGWEVDVACRLDEEIPYCNNAFDLPLERNPFRPASLKAIKMLKKIIAEGNYDVVHCHTLCGRIIGVTAAKEFRKKGTLKIVTTVHGFLFYNGGSRLKRALLMPIEKHLAKDVDVIMLQNQEDYDTVINNKLGVKYILKHRGAGVNFEKLSNQTLDSAERSEYRKKIGLSDDDFIIIYAAEITKDKNQIALVKALKLLKERMPNAKLLLPGIEHDRGNLRRFIQKNGLSDRVLCLGWRDDIGQLLCCSDVFAASSIREGLGICILEAMYCGLPVVAFDNRGHRETVINGITGVLLPQNDVQGFADSIYRYYSDRDFRDSVTSNARASLSEFEEMNVVDKLCEIYDKYVINEDKLHG